VGCGSAGAAAALFLARDGHAVDVFERVAEPKPIGAGITLQPTGQAVLARLGLLAPVAARGARLERLWCRRLGGRTLVDLRYADIDPELHGIGLHRGVLFQTLHDAVKVEPGVTLRCGHGVEAMPRDGATRWLVTKDGARHGPYDLVVVADGSVSELHDDTSIPTKVKPYAWGALWFVAEDRDGKHGPVLDQIVHRARTMCGLLPTGLGPTGDTPLISLFWSIRADRVDAWKQAGLAAWKQEARAYDPRMDAALAQIADASQVLFTQYKDVSMKHWHEPGAVFLGDAAHATSPQLGQGANLALYDAMELADALRTATSVEAGLAAYTLARKRHLGYYQFATRALTPFFQGDSRFLAWMRDWTFPTSRWLGFLRRRMVRTMAGLDRGIVRRPIPLAPLKQQIAAPRLPSSR